MGHSSRGEQVSDELLAINGAPTAGMSHAQALARIRGGGSRLRLLLRRPHGETPTPSTPRVPTGPPQFNGDRAGSPTFTGTGWERPQVTHPRAPPKSLVHPGTP